MGEILLCRFTCAPTTDQERGNKNGTGNDHWLTLNVSLLRLDSSQAEFSGSSYTVLSAAEILPHPEKEKKKNAWVTPPLRGCPEKTQSKCQK